MKFNYESEKRKFEKNKQNRDPRPKRRKDRYNPYNIFTIGINTDVPQYVLEFQDGQGMQISMEIEEEVYAAFNSFELKDLSFMNEVDRHYEQSEQTEISLKNRAVNQQESVEKTVFRKMQHEELHKAIERLPELQKRRLMLYYFENLTYEEIAKREGCTIMPVKRAIDAAVEKLRKCLKD